MTRKGDFLPGDTKRFSVEDTHKFMADSACKFAVPFIKFQASFIDCRIRSSHITHLPAVLSIKSTAHSNSNASDKDNAERKILVFYDYPNNGHFIPKGLL